MTEIDSQSGGMLARSHWSAGFGPRVAFADLSGRQQSWTGDRQEFLGRDGTLDHPAALAESTPLTNRVGGGVDPCGALQTTVELDPNGVAGIVFLLGETATRAEALSLALCYRAADLDAVLSAATGAWRDALGRVQVKTPDRAMDRYQITVENPTGVSRGVLRTLVDGKAVQTSDEGIASVG